MGPPGPGGHSGSASASLVVPCDSFSPASRRSQRRGSDLHKKQLQGGFFRPPPAPGCTARILNDANCFARLSAVAFEDEVAPAPPATLPKLRQAGRLQWAIGCAYAVPQRLYNATNRFIASEEGLHARKLLCKKNRIFAVNDREPRRWTPYKHS